MIRNLLPASILRSAVILMRPLTALVCLIGFATVCAGADSAGRPCTVEGDAPAADVERATRTCRELEARFEALFGHSPPKGQISLSRRIGFDLSVKDGQWVVVWPTSADLRSAAHTLGHKGNEVEEFVANQWETALPHEAGHVLMAAYFFPKNAIGSASGHYGTLLPDWFDEAVAMWMEPVGMRERRLGQLRNGKVFSLEEVLSARHPLMNSVGGRYSRSITNGPCRGSCPGSEHTAVARRITWELSFDGRASVDTVYGSQALSASDEYALSYPYAFGVLSYIEQRGGSTALQALIERLRADPDIPNPLLGLPGLAGKAEVLERDWTAWLAADVSRLPYYQNSRAQKTLKASAGTARTVALGGQATHARPRA